jgi:hypothetical protein
LETINPSARFSLGGHVDSNMKLADDGGWVDKWEKQWMPSDTKSHMVFD